MNITAIQNLLPAAILAPAAAAVLLAIVGGRLAYAWQCVIAVAGAAVSFAAILGLALTRDSLLGFSDVAWYGGDWLLTADLQAALVLYFDRLSLLMSLLVTGFGALIVLYSAQYMDHEEDTARYFASISLFLAAMMVLVLAENLFVVFIGWEGVGLASYLLIGHYWKTTFAPPAAMRAFFVNRVGDLFFIIGVFLLFQATGTVSLPALEMQGALSARGASQYDVDLLGWAALFLLGGIFGKSAQMPLHVWLPDAMAGPTPVSALIHAATMVTSGVYLMTRLDWLYTLAPAARDVVFYAALITTLIGSTLACVQHDIKKVLAYSTLAHLALMFLALSAGDAPAGMMHLFGHAAFKALLFLAAGSVIYFQHHEQDLRKLRGVLKFMPVTRAALWIGAIGAAGFVPYLSASFFSKELVMHAVHHGHGGFAYWLIFLAELLGVVYMFRLLGCLEGESIASGDHSLHSVGRESGWIIRGVLSVLMLVSVLFGWFSASPAFGGSGFLYSMLAGVQAMPEADLLSVVKNVASGLIVAALAFYFYRKDPELAGKINALPPLRANYYFNEAYEAALLRPLGVMARLAFSVMEGPFFSGALRQTGAGFQKLSRGLRVLQDGYINQYALIVVLAVLGILGALWFRL